MVILMDIEIGKRIKAHRLLNRMSRSDLAKRFGITEQAIGMYERGEREPNIEQIKQLALMFNLTTDYLLGHMPLTPEAEFLMNIDLSIDEIMARQAIKLDGQSLSKEEVTMAVASVRAFRDMMKARDGE
jgi:transcriptional regulator with XRE-family HTH domain